MIVSAVTFRRKLGIVFTVLVVALGTYGQKQSNPLTQQNNPIGTLPAAPPVQVRSLTEPSPAVVSDQFKEGQVYEHVNTLEYRVEQIEVKMQSVLDDLGFAKGAFWAIAGLIGGIIVIVSLVLKRWWKPIVRSLVKDSYIE
jgi:hypothetical protein